jgi:tetratricopeptide (TPR) repeat protein
LCLNCLLRAGLSDKDAAAGRDAFKEALAAVRSRDGDWHVADHEIVHEIARGGMGVVYQAREPHSGRIVALKCVLAYHGDSDQMVARFRREAETAARLDHPHIVPIYQIGETADGFPYYTMKYAPNGSLLQARRPLLQHPRQSVELMLKVARAVHFAHEQGVLHRDLKPGNILLDSHGEPLVSDFGLARCEAVSSYLTRSLSSFGTPGYIAPEQADGPSATLTPAADIYSLGAMLFELLTGQTPFVGDNAFTVMKRSAEEDAPKLSSVVPRADRDLETICAHSLEREPGDRYPSAAELADDLQRWLDDRPIRARPPTAWIQTSRWIRRNRWLAASLTALILLCVAMGVWQVRAGRVEAEMKESVLAARSVMVLPFLDLDTVSTDRGATGSLVDLMKGQLQSRGPARVTSTEVPGWSRGADIRKAASDLKARLVMTGTTRNVGGMRRISVRLFDPATGKTLFNTVLEETDSTLKAQSPAITQWIDYVEMLLVANTWSGMGSSDPIANNEKASEAITSGRSWMESYSVSHLDRAIQLFRKAIAEQPDSASAHAYLAIAAITRTHFVADWAYLEQGKMEALKALELDPNSVVGHRALSGVYYQEGKFDEALEQQLRTIELGGVDDKVSSFVGQTHDQLGRPDLALKWFEIASRLQTYPGDVEPAIGDAWARLGEDDEALRAYDKAIELRPGASRGAIGKAHLRMLRGEFDAAREICFDRFRNQNELGEMTQLAAQLEFVVHNWDAAEELYTKLVRTDAAGGGSFYGSISFQSALGRIKQATGSGEEATRLLREALKTETATFERQPSNPDAAYRVAAVEASLDLVRPALQHLRRAIDLGWIDYRCLERDPRFDSLRGNPDLRTFIDGLSARVAELRSKTKVQ